MNESKFYNELLDNLSKQPFEREFHILNEMFKERDRILAAYNTNSVFKYANTLNFSYVPPILKERDDVLLSLIFNFRRILEEEEPPSINCALLGRGGTGKSLVARYFGNLFKKIAEEKQKRIIVEYYNCIAFKSKSRILRDLLVKNTLGSGRGYSDEEVLKLILKKLIENDEYLLLIIDEVHLLKPYDVLALLDIAETFGHQNAKLSILLICRNRDWIRLENERILSRINDKLLLRPYNFKEAQKVLEFRSELAFKEGVVSWEIIDVISRIVGEYKNMHHGIKILMNSGIMADREGMNHITLNMVKDVSKDLYPSFRETILDNFEDQELFTLYGIAKVIIDSGNPFTVVDESYEEYQTICEAYGIEPHVKMSFRKYIRKLIRLNAIYVKTVRIEEAERGRRLEIYLQDIPAKKLVESLIEMFNERYN